MPFIIVGTKPFRDPNRLTELPRETPFQQYPQAWYRVLTLCKPYFRDGYPSRVTLFCREVSTVRSEAHSKVKIQGITGEKRIL